MLLTWLTMLLIFYKKQSVAGILFAVKKNTIACQEWLPWRVPGS